MTDVSRPDPSGEGDGGRDGEPDEERTGEQPAETREPAKSGETPGTPVAGTPIAESTIETPAAPERPLPAYGEYAPEGWEWKPEEPEAPAASQDHAPAAASTTAPTLPGVPHNLGAGSPLPQRGAKGNAARGQGATGAPRSQQQTPAAAARAAGTGAAASAASPARPPRMADRIVTTLLLALGAIGALQCAFAMFNIGTTFALMGDAPGVQSFSAPDWLGTTGKVVGVAFLALYALTLVYSIRRLRSGKLTFWAPLAAGTLAIIVMLIVVFAAMMNIPELGEIITDPEQYAKLMEHIQGLQTP